MYNDFYHLKKDPFHITPDPEFLYPSPSHREALASIVYGINKGKGFIVVTGEVGLGKTTLLRSYLETADKELLKIIYIFNSNVSFEGLLQAMFQELGIDPGTDGTFGMIHRLHQLMIEEFKSGRKVVLIIDEAQNMPVETLENLRMLSNLETSNDKLIQIVLVGQPEFERMLELKGLRQLKQRMAVHCTLSPLTEKESMDYIQFRLAKVGMERARVFTAGAFKKIARKAAGVPRILNILCDNALIAGFGYRQKPVTSKIAKQVISDYEGKQRSFRWKWICVPAAVLILVACLFYIHPCSPSLWPSLVGGMK